MPPSVHDFGMNTLLKTKPMLSKLTTPGSHLNPTLGLQRKEGHQTFKAVTCDCKLLLPGWKQCVLVLEELVFSGAVVAHTFNPSTLEAEEVGSLSLRPA